MSCGDIFLGLIAILFPPVAVWIKSGICSADSLINILLCMLGYLPGLLHAWYIIARNPERDWDYEPIPADAEGQQRVTYYYIRHERLENEPGPGQQRPPPPPPPQRDYGSTHPNPSTGPQQQAAANVKSKPAQRAPPPPPPPPESRPTAGPSVGAGGDEPGAPPSYSDVVKGDNKVQTQD